MSTPLLPPSWIEKPLSDVAHVIQGQSPPGSSYNSDGNGLPFFQGKTEFGPLTPVVRQWSTEPKKVAEPGDVLISIRAPVGPTNLADIECSIGRGLAAIRPEGGIPSKFLLYYLRHSVSLLARQGTGTTFKAISGAQLRSHPTVVPPVKEAHRIVEAIESYFTRLDDAVANLERVQRNLKRYRASVLKSAVEGRLVPTEAELARAEGRDYEPASVLLERILAERRRRWEEAELAKMEAKGKPPKNDKWKAKYKKPAAPDATLLQSLPEGWLWVSLAQLFETITDGDHQPPPQTPEGIPFLVIGNVKTGRVDLSDTRFVSQEYYESLDEPRKPRIGDLLYTVTGSYGIPVRVVNESPFCVQRHIAILRPTACSKAGFLYYVFQSQAVFEQATCKATGTAQKTVGLKSLREFVVPLPPSGEQDRILASLEDHFSRIDNTASVVGASVVRCSRLRQSVLRWAFRGKLVDQDPNDEPATVLLDRISGERIATSTSKKAAKRGRKKTRSTKA